MKYVIRHSTETCYWSPAWHPDLNQAYKYSSHKEAGDELDRLVETWPWMRESVVVTVADAQVSEIMIQ